MVHPIIIILIVIVVLVIIVKGIKPTPEIPERVPAAKPKPSTNCDGCRLQETCKYGYMVYDDIEHFRLTLADKYIFADPCGDKLRELDNKYSDVQNPNLFSVHSKKKMERLKKETVHRRLQYQEEYRSVMLNTSKCSNAEYRKDGATKAEIKMLQEIYFNYDTVKEKVKAEDSLKAEVRKYILDSLEQEEYILQRDVYDKFDRSQPAFDAVSELVKENRIEKIKYSNTYKLLKNRHLDLATLQKEIASKEPGNYPYITTTAGAIEYGDYVIEKAKQNKE